MNGRRSILAATILASALSLAAPLGAAERAVKTPITIKTSLQGNLLVSGTASGRFTLELGTVFDAGRMTLKYSYGGARRTAAGQTFRPGDRTETFTGKQGSLTIHSAGMQFPVGVQGPKDPDGDSEVWVGTWSIVRGTGKYAGLTGGGGVAGIVEIAPGKGLTLDYFHRYEGFASRS